jgi:hypothetical protein
VIMDITGPCFCDDAELGYLRSRTVFAEGEPLRLDEAYRLAHLPLVAPRHARVIARRDGAGYEMGRHEQVFSLVLPVPWEALRASPAYRELESDIAAQNFAGKLAFDLLERRGGKLHATICGRLGTGETPPSFDPQALGALEHLGPISVELRGLFSGNVNLGRLYLRAYPERRDGANMFRRIQKLLGRPETDLYVVGLHNLVDDLDAAEAASLAALIARWWDRPILRFQADSLWLLGAKDDLVLDSAVFGTIALTSS